MNDLSRRLEQRLAAVKLTLVHELDGERHHDGTGRVLEQAVSLHSRWGLGASTSPTVRRAGHNTRRRGRQGERTRWQTG